MYDHARKEFVLVHRLGSHALVRLDLAPKLAGDQGGHLYVGLKRCHCRGSES